MEVIMFNHIVSEADITAIKSLSYQERESLMLAINGTEPNNILAPAKNGGFICPICGNGSGKDATGVIPTLENGIWLYGCRRGDCQFNGDLIKIISKVNNINKDTFDGFCKVLAIGAEICHINYHSSNKFYNLNAVASSTNLKNKPVKDYSKFLSFTRENLKSWLDSIGGLWRDLTFETLQHFNCGFFPEWGKEKTPRIIIPANNTNFLARLAIPLESLPIKIQKTVKPKQHAGIKTLFNSIALESDLAIIVVEGYIDAMSIWQATKDKFPVVALGGADGGNILLTEIDKLFKDKLSKPKFILLFDSDETGRKSAKDLCEKLIQINCPAVVNFLSDKDSKIDANDILQKNPSELEKVIDNIYETSSESLKNISSKIDIEKKIKIWSDANGTINPNTLQEIYDSEDFLNKLKIENLTVSKVTDDKTIRAVALCKFYDFFASCYTNFINQLVVAKENARKNIRSASKEKSNDAPDVEFIGLAKLPLSDYRRNIEINVSKVRREHQEYQKKLAQELAREKSAEHQAFLSAMTTRTNCPDAPIELTLPIAFESTFSPEGITAVIKGVRRKIALTPILPTKKFIDPESNLTNYEIAIRDEKGIWKRAIFDAQTIADSKKILALTDYGAYFSGQEAKSLSSYLMHLIGDPANRYKIPICKMYQQTGWTDDSFTKFIYPPGDGENFIVRGGNFDFVRAFSTRGDYGKWVQMFKKVKSTSIVARLVIGAAASAPLIHLLNLRNLQLHLATPSGNGKSAAVKFALSIFGNPEKIKFKFDGTANSFDTMGLLFNDLPSFIDELQSANKKIRENIDTLIYNFESGVNRSRNRKDNTLQTRKYFRGVRISTGEQSLTTEFSGEGAISRILEITRSEIFSDDFAVEIHQFVKQHYGQVGKKWIDYIIANDAKIQQDYNFLESEYGKKEKNLMPNHISTIAAFHTALIHFENMLGFNRDIAIEECIADFYSLIKDLPRKNLSTNISRAFQTVREFISSHPRYFKVQTQDGKKFVFPEGDAYEIYGVKFRDGTIGFFPRALREILKDFPSANAVIRGFGENNFFDTSNNPKHPFQKVRRVDENSVWLYVFSEKVMSID